VANAHAWESFSLVFSNGTAAYSAKHAANDPSAKGIASYFASEILFYDLMMISGWKGVSGRLTVDSQGGVSSKSNHSDVLLRKRA
jgi:hypothetical protein